MRKSFQFHDVVIRETCPIDMVYGKRRLDTVLHLVVYKYSYIHNYKHKCMHDLCENKYHPSINSLPISLLRINSLIVDTHNSSIIDKT